MKKTKSDMKSHYDFSKGVRGKYADRDMLSPSKVAPGNEDEMVKEKKLMGGCNERDEWTDEELAARAEENEEREAERKRVREIKAEAENTWVRFVDKGLAGITQQELDDQFQRTVRLVNIRSRRAALEAESMALENELSDLLHRCIHLTSNGESAFEPGMYDICAICRDTR